MTTVEKITNPAPKTFPLVTVTTDSGTLAVPCEPINEWIAITPVFAMDTDGNGLLDGGFTLTHRPTGLELVEGPGCIECCRSAGKALASMDADWSALTAENGRDFATALSDETRHAFAETRAVAWLCDAEYCDFGTSGREIELTEVSAR